MNPDACVRLLTEISEGIRSDVLYGKDRLYKEALDYAAKIISQNTASALALNWVTIHNKEYEVGKDGVKAIKLGVVVCPTDKSEIMIEYEDGKTERFPTK